MNNKLETVFKGYNVFSAKCDLCHDDRRVHSIKYIGISREQDDQERPNKEGVLLIQPGYAKDYEVSGVPHHFWQEINRAGLESDKLCFLFDMTGLHFSIKSINTAIAMYNVIRVFTASNLGRIVVVNASKHLGLFLKAIPYFRVEDLAVVKLEQLSTLLTHEQLTHLLP